MGGSLNAEEGVFHYYVFQKKLEDYLNGGIYKKDNKKIKEGYILNPRYVSTWKKGINYESIENYLMNLNITTYKIKSELKGNIDKVIRNNINQYYNYTLTNSFQANKTEYLQISEKIISKIYLERFVSKKIFECAGGVPQSINDLCNYIAFEHFDAKKDSIDTSNPEFYDGCNRWILERMKPEYELIYSFFIANVNRKVRSKLSKGPASPFQQLIA